METFVATGLVVMGIGIAGMWTRDILGSDSVDLTDGVFAARDPDSGSLFWPHWIAEYATAIALAIAGIGLFADASWAGAVAGVAAGALLYTSVNSLAWALAQPDRRPYAAPMVLGIVVAVAAIVHIL